MATITKTIGTSSRDYSTISAWASDLDDTGIYTSGDDAVGVIYNDTQFTETSLNLSGGGTVGLNSITLTVNEADRHDGTEGSGANWRVGGNGYFMSIQSNVPTITIEWLEFNGSGRIIADGIVCNNYSTSSTVIIRNCILRDMYTAYGAFFGAIYGATSIQYNVYVLNNIVYNVGSTQNSSNNACGIQMNGDSSRTIAIYNNTVYNVTRDNGTASGFGICSADNASSYVKNNIVCNVNGTSSGSHDCYNSYSYSSADIDYNMADDTTAQGANSINSVTASNQFVSVTGGSEDFHLKAGADALDEGVDLGTTNGVNFDIDGQDRDSLGVTWDMGADELYSGNLQTATFSALTLTVANPSTTASYQVYKTSSYSPLVLTLNIPSITSTYDSIQLASVTPITINLSIPTMIATGIIGRTYITYDNNRLEIWVGGVNVVRFNPDGSIDVNGDVNGNAF